MSQRAVVSRRRKLVLLAQALSQGAVMGRGSPHEGSAPLAAVRFLVEAAAEAAAPRTAGTRLRASGSSVLPHPPMGAGERVVWVIDLFERQARRRQMKHLGRLSH